jgi:hypothetical protein
MDGHEENEEKYDVTARVCEKHGEKRTRNTDHTAEEQHDRPLDQNADNERHDPGDCRECIPAWTIQEPVRAD